MVPTHQPDIDKGNQEKINGEVSIWVAEFWGMIILMGGSYFNID